LKGGTDRKIWEKKRKTKAKSLRKEGDNYKGKKEAADVNWRGGKGPLRKFRTRFGARRGWWKKGRSYKGKKSRRRRGAHKGGL